MRAAHLINAAEDSGMMKSGAHWRRRLTKSARARSARSGGLGGPGGLRPRHRAPPPAALEEREHRVGLGPRNLYEARHRQDQLASGPGPASWRQRTTLTERPQHAV